MPIGLRGETMRRVATGALLLIAILMGALTPAYAIIGPPPPPPPPPPVVTTTRPIPPLVWYGFGAIGCAAVSPMIGTVVLGRELTQIEVSRMSLSCFLGPV